MALESASPWRFCRTPTRWWGYGLHFAVQGLRGGPLNGLEGRWLAPCVPAVGGALRVAHLTMRSSLEIGSFWFPGVHWFPGGSMLASICVASLTYVGDACGLDPSQGILCDLRPHNVLKHIVLGGGWCCCRSLQNAAICVAPPAH